MPELSRKETTGLSTSQHTDNEDKVSESGTYTIEDDNNELQAARQNIDKLFGVTG